MKKKTALFLLPFLLSCSKEPVSKEHIYFLFATPLAEHESWLKAKRGFDDACSTYDIQCSWEGPTGIDTERMEEVIQTGIIQKTDAIITQGVIRESIVEEAKEAGIPMVLVDSDIADSQSFAYIGKNFKQQAEILLEDIERYYGTEKKLNVAIQVAELNFQIAKDQIKEIEDVFSTHAGGFEIISVSESKSDNVRAKQAWEEVMENSESINVCINFAGESAASCYEAAMKYNRRDQMLIYGVDEVPEVMELIEQGKIEGSIVASFYDYGYDSVKFLYEYITEQKEPQQRVQDVELVLVKQDNVHKYLEENLQ